MKGDLTPNSNMSLNVHPTNCGICYLLIVVCLLIMNDPVNGSMELLANNINWLSVRYHSRANSIIGAFHLGSPQSS